MEQTLTRRSAFCATCIADARDAFSAAGVEVTSRDITTLAITLFIEEMKRSQRPATPQPNGHQPAAALPPVPAPPPVPGYQPPAQATKQQPGQQFITGPNGRPVCPVHGTEMVMGQYGWYCNSKAAPGHPTNAKGYCNYRPDKNWQPASVAPLAQPAPQQHVATNDYDAQQFPTDDLPF